MARESPSQIDGITLWVRDGFSATEASVLADIQKLSTDDPTLHLFLPKLPGDGLKNAIASVQAAQETINLRGNPTSIEGKECRQAMVTKQLTQEESRPRLDRGHHQERQPLPFRRTGTAPHCPQSWSRRCCQAGSKPPVPQIHRRRLCKMAAGFQEGQRRFPQRFE